MQGALMRKIYVSIVFATSLMCGSSFAGQMGTPIEPPMWSWVLTLSGGAAWQTGSETQTLDIAPEIIKTYVDQQSTNTLADGELFLGMQHRLSEAFVGQIGIEGAVTSNANISGLIWDDAEQMFDNYLFNYKIQHSHVALKGKLLLDKGYWLLPWISGSLGVGFNNAHAFTNTPLLYEAVPNPNFASNTSTSFTYTVGAGLQKVISQNWQIGIGYEFADWGQSQLGVAEGQVGTGRLGLNHLYTNGVLLNITYIA